MTTSLNPFLSSRMHAIQESPTLAITAKAIAYRLQGRDVISLAAGEPDFDTPNHIKSVAKKAIDEGFTKYTPVSGTNGLKMAIVRKLARENQLSYTVDEVIVGVGGKQCIFNAFFALLNPSDEVIIPAPYWVSYADIALLAGARPVIINADIEQNFKITPQQLADAITPKTKLMVINSPSNPTGARYSHDELSALGAVLLKHPQVMVLTDDIYEHINLDNTSFCNIVNAMPELKARTIVVNGVSKSYAMTGWRIGYAAGESWLIKAMEVIQSQSTSNPTSIAQVAAQSALDGGIACIAPMVQAFRERHHFVLDYINDLHGLLCLPAQGAFYTFVQAKPVIEHLYKVKKIKEATDIAFAEYLLEQHNVAVVPGSAFGSEGYFRISFATSMSNLEKGLLRIRQALD